MDGRGAQIAAGTDVLGELRAVSTDLTASRRLCPPGRLAELTEAVTSTDAALTTAVADDEGAREFAVTAGQEQERIDGELAALRVAERAADRRAGDLRRLADDVAAAEQQRPRLGELDEAVKVAERRSGELTEQRDRRNAEVTEAARAAENARDRAERHVSEMCNVVTSTGRRAEVVPEASVSALRGLYRAAVSAYAKVEVGQDLRAAADTAASEAARLRTDVAGHPEADVARGEFLLASVDGSDPAGRRAAAARAERERQRLDRELEAAVSKVGALGNELKGATPQDNRNVWIVLDAELRPTSAENGRFLLEQAVELQREAQFELDQANAVAQTVKEKAGAAAETVRAFGEVLTPLEALLDNATAAVDSAAVAEPLDGTAEQAKEALVDLRVRLSAARREDGDSVRQVNGLVDVAIRFAAEPRFEQMTNVARRSLVGLDRELVAARAGEFADQLAARLATLTSDLNTASRHRKLIVERLGALVDGALKTLRTASRLSKLPDAMDDWAGKEFLRIRFTEPDPSLLSARIGEVVDEIAAAMTRGPHAAQRQSATG